MATERTIFVPFATSFGGVERLAVSLAQHLYRRGVPHRLVCLRCTIDLPKYAGYALRVESLEPRRNPLAEARAMARALRGRGDASLLFDLKSAFYAGLAALPPFVLHLTDPPSLLPAEVSKHGFTARRRHPPLARGLAPRLSVSLHGELVHRINMRGVRRAARVIAMTDAIAAELLALYGVTAAVVRPGVPTPTAPAAHRTRDRLLSVSRLEVSKRVDWILEALARNAAAGWSLDVVGEGADAPRLHALADRLGLTGRVAFHGHVSEGRLGELYAAAGLFVMPAIQGYGLPALEALARGVPVVLSRNSGVAEVLADTRWATPFSGGVDGLVAAIGTQTARLSHHLSEGAPPPVVPTEDQWAGELCRLCGWA